jgi:protein-disulfide isomerase
MLRPRFHGALTAPPRKVRVYSRHPFLAILLLIPFWAVHADAQETKPVASSALQAILAPPLATPASGATQPQVTVIEYFDYDCPVCRRLAPELGKLVQHDAGVRLIYKDWPIFGEASEYAAYCSFAAARQGKYQAVHEALIGSRRDLDSEDAVRSTLKEAGFDVREFDADIKAHAKEYSETLARNRREAAALGLRGTPGLIVGRRLVLGSADYARLVELAQQARGDVSHP